MKKGYLLLIIMLLASAFACALAEEDNDSIASAVHIEVNTDVSEFISSTKDADCFCFELEHPGSVRLSFSHEYEDSDLNWLVQVLDADSNIYLEKGFQGRTFSQTDTCSIGLPAGTFFVKVRPYYSNSYCSGVYTFRVHYEASDAWETEFNDNIAYGSDAVPVNTNISGNIARQKDVDYYRFELHEPGPVSVTFSHDYEETDLCWKLDFINAEGKTLTEKSFRGSEMMPIATSTVGLPAGSYFIKISSYYSNAFSSKTYTFCVNFEASSQWETELNDNIASGSDPISLNTDTFGAMNHQKDTDCFLFRTEEDGVAHIVFSHDYDDSEKQWRLEVLDAAGNSYLNQVYRGDTMSETVSCPLGLQAGLYYVRIKPCFSNSYCSGTYDLRVNFEAALDWETEYNNTPVLADEGQLNRWIQGAVAGTDDRDYFVYQLNEEREYTFHFQHGISSGSDKPWHAEILDQNQRSLADWSYRYTDVTDIPNTVVLGPGTYYVMVRSTYSNYAPAEAYSLMLE